MSEWVGKTSANDGLITDNKLIYRNTRQSRALLKPINCDIFVRWKTINVYSSTGYSLAREKCIHFDHHGDEFWTICYCWFNEYIRLLTINYQVRLCSQPRVLFTCTFHCIWKQTIYLTTFKLKKRHVNCLN